MKTYFTSDLHLGHGNIMKYCGRTMFMTKEDKELYKYYVNATEKEQMAFKISEESLSNMNDALIKRWNSRVKPEDTVIHNGDFCFKNSKNRGEGINMKAEDWEEHLDGKIIYIKGNHDKNNTTKTIIHSLILDVGEKLVNVVHNPAHLDNRFDINLVGHVHEKWKVQRKVTQFQIVDCINIGVDVWNFYPVTYEEIIERYKKWQKGDR